MQIAVTGKYLKLSGYRFVNFVPARVRVMELQKSLGCR